MVFLFIMLIILLLILAISTIKIKFNIEEIKMNLSLEKKIKNINYKISVIIYIFYKVPIFKISISPKMMKKIEKVTKWQDLKGKIIRNENKIDLDILEIINNLQTELKRFELKIHIGIENVILTSTVVFIISIIISFILKKYSTKNTKQYFKIMPKYGDENFIDLQFNGIFEIKMIHIINTICIEKKKRRVEENERASNRRSYDYSYE